MPAAGSCWWSLSAAKPSPASAPALRSFWPGRSAIAGGGWPCSTPSTSCFPYLTPRVGRGKQSGGRSGDELEPLVIACGDVAADVGVSVEAADVHHEDPLLTLDVRPEVPGVGPLVKRAVGGLVDLLSPPILARLGGVDG